jgi:hypothetical protein
LVSETEVAPERERFAERREHADQREVRDKLRRRAGADSADVDNGSERRENR